MMNAYNLGISGNWIFVILLSLAVAGASFLYYRYTVPPVSRTSRIILMSLRWMALTLLLFILFEPVFTRVFGDVIKPKIAVFIDNSLSAGMKDAKIDRDKQIKMAIAKSGILKENPELMKTFLFDRDVFEVINLNLDSLKLNGQATDISKAIRRLIPNNDQNIRAGILISDGSFNTGNNPLYDITVLDKPLYTIGIGDSTPVKDVSVESIITNEIAYLGDMVPVNVSVKSSGFQSVTINLHLFENGKKIASKELNISNAHQDFNASFDYTPSIEGDHKLTATIDGIDGEMTKKNNSYSDYIKVLKNKRNILVFAGSPSPDLSFISNILKQEKNVEIKTFIQKKGSEFYEGNPTAANFHDAEMIFLIGFPISSSSDATIQLIKKELAGGKPVFFISSSMINYPKLAQLEDFLPFKTISGNANEFLVLPDFQESASSHPLLRVSGSDKDLDLWKTLPPIFKTEHFVTIKPESEKIAGAKINNTAIKDPLILSRVFQNQKSIAILASGIYRWKLMGYGSEISKGNSTATDLFSTFVQNSIRWLSVDRQNKNVTIKTTKKHYTIGEKVGVTAQIYDASYIPVEDALVKVKISGGKGSNNNSENNTGRYTQRDIVLSPLGNGRYYSEVEGLGEGEYAFKGEVSKGGNILGSDAGRFSVGEIVLEYQNLSMNSQLLRDLAEQSGGKFYLPENCSNILNDIKAHKKFKDRSITTRKEYALWNIWWIMAAIIALLATEWTIRKRLGMI